MKSKSWCLLTDRDRSAIFQRKMKEPYQDQLRWVVKTTKNHRSSRQVSNVLKLDDSLADDLFRGKITFEFIRSQMNPQDGPRVNLK